MIYVVICFETDGLFDRKLTVLFFNMTKEELIQELVKARITEARLKKGYEVKGDGTVILYGSKNTR